MFFFNYLIQREEHEANQSTSRLIYVRYFLPPFSYNNNNNMTMVTLGHLVNNER